MTEQEEYNQVEQAQPQTCATCGHDIGFHSSFRERFCLMKDCSCEKFTPRNYMDIAKAHQEFQESQIEKGCGKKFICPNGGYEQVCGVPYGHCEIILCPKCTGKGVSSFQSQDKPPINHSPQKNEASKVISPPGGTFNLSHCIDTDDTDPCIATEYVKIFIKKLCYNFMLKCSNSKDYNKFKEEIDKLAGKTLVEDANRGDGLI